MIGLIILDGEFEFFHMVDDVDFQRADTIFHSTFFVDGNHAGRTPCADVIAALKVWGAGNV